MTRKRLRRTPIALVVIGAIAIAVGLPSIGRAAITAPVPSGGNPNNIVKGAVPISDDYFNASNTPQSCTTSFATGVTIRGVTKLEIFTGPADVGTPVLTNNFVNYSQGTGSGGPYTIAGLTGFQTPVWTTDASTFTIPRGQYTIRASYFKLASGVSGACHASSNCASSPTYGTLTNPGILGFMTGCFPASKVGVSEGIPSTKTTVDVENKYGLAITNLPGGTGPYITADTGPTTATVNARLTDPGRSGSPGINGKTVTFSVAGLPSQNVVTATVGGVSGFASATFNMAGSTFGSHTLTVTGPPTDGFFVTPDAVVNAIKFGGASVTTYTGPGSMYWNEALPASAHVQAVQSGGGTPPDGAVKFTLGPTGKQVVQTVPSVDANGNAATSLQLPTSVDPPSAPLKIEYAGSSDGSFNPSSVSTTINVLKRPTSLTYVGGNAARYGDDITYAADLKDVTPGSPLFGTGLGGRTVTFQITGGAPVDVVTDPNGHASITTPLFGNVGQYDVTVTYLGDTHYVGSTDTKPVSIDYRYIFKDDNSPQFFDMNPGTLQYGFRSPTVNTGTLMDPLMFSIFLPKNIYFTLPSLPTVPANILDSLLDVGPDKPDVKQVHITLRIGSLDVSVDRDPATNPIPIGGFTLGDLLNKIQTGHYPTDLDTCELLYGSTCERRIVVLTDLMHNGIRVPVGVFDVKTGLFVALTTVPGPQILSSFGNCFADVVACAGLPLGEVIDVGLLPPISVPVTPPAVP
jgi:hypothetical protein